MILIGAIHSVFPEERYGDFIKKVFWIKEINVKYPNYFALEMWHDDVSALNHFKEADVVQCEIKITGKIWRKNDKENVINTLRCIGIKKV